MTGKFRTWLATALTVLAGLTIASALAVPAMAQGKTLTVRFYDDPAGFDPANIFRIENENIAFNILSGLLPLMLFNDIKPRQEEASHSESHGMPVLLLILPFLCVLLANFGFFLTRTAGRWQMISLLADQRHAIGPDQLGLAMSLSAVANLVSLPIAAILVDRAPRAAIIAFSLLATAAALAGIAVADSQVMLFVGMIAIGLATGIGGPAIGAHAVDVVPVRQQGPAMGLLRFAGDFGYLVGPLAIGAIVDFGHIGYDGGLLLNAVLLVAFGAVFMLGGRRLLTSRPYEHPLPREPRRPMIMTDRIWDKYLSAEDKAVFAASGFGSLAEWGKRPALLIIDVNYAFCDEKPTPILEASRSGARPAENMPGKPCRCSRNSSRPAVARAFRSSTPPGPSATTDGMPAPGPGKARAARKRLSPPRRN
jgi:hypothetical protein